MALLPVPSPGAGTTTTATVGALPPRVRPMEIFLIWVFIVALAAAALPCSAASAAAGCDLFQGRWVADKSYPLYDASACPFVPDVFDCRRNGRPDDAYLKFRWSPANCQLPRSYKLVLPGLAKLVPM